MEFRYIGLCVCICKQTTNNRKKTIQNNNKNRADLIRKMKSTLVEALLEFKIAFKSYFCTQKL